MKKHIIIAIFIINDVITIFKKVNAHLQFHAKSAIIKVRQVKTIEKSP